MRRSELSALFALAALWGASFLFIRVAVPALGPVPLAAGRVALAAVLLGGAAVATGQSLALRAHARQLLVLGGVNAALPFALIGFAELRLTASLAAMLNATVPMFAAVLGAVWLRERVSGPRASGLLLGVVGVGVLLGWSPVPLDRGTLVGVAAMLVAACCYAIAGIYTKRNLSGVSAVSLTLGQQLGATAWLAAPAVWQLPSARFTPAAATALVALAVLCTAVAYLLYFFLIARVGPTRTTTVTYLIPVFGTLWGVLFLGESVTRGMLAGLACIVASVALVNGVSPGRAVAGGRLTALTARR